MIRRRTTNAGEILAKHTKESIIPALSPLEQQEFHEDLRNIFSNFFNNVLKGSILFPDKAIVALDWCDQNSFDYKTMSLKSWGDNGVYVTLSNKAKEDFALLNMINLQAAKDEISFYGGHMFQNNRIYEMLEKSKSVTGSRPLSIEHARMMMAHEGLIPEWIKESGHTYIFPGAVLANKSAFVLAMRWSPIRGRLEFDVISLIEPWKETYHILII